MQRELYEVEKDRFDLKDSSLYHLQGTWPKDHKPEAVLDGEKLPQLYPPLPERRREDRDEL